MQRTDVRTVASNRHSLHTLAALHDAVDAVHVVVSVFVVMDSFHAQRLHAQSLGPHFCLIVIQVRRLCIQRNDT